MPAVEYIEVMGQRVPVETRECTLCGGKFRVHPKSTQTAHKVCSADGRKAESQLKYRSADRVYTPANQRQDGRLNFEAYDGGKNRQGASVDPMTPKEPKRDRKIQVRPRPGGDYETEWKRCTEAARKIVLEMNRKRMEVAELALSVCKIDHGGGNHWSGFKGIRTLKDFAIEAGVAYKTLHTWVQIKRRVVDALPQGVYSEENYSAARRTFKNVSKHGTRDPNKIRDIYESEKNRVGSDFKFWHLIRYMRHVRNTVSRLDWNMVRPEEIKEMAALLNDLQIKMRLHGKDWSSIKKND